MTSNLVGEMVENMHPTNMADSAGEESTTKKYHPIMLRNKEGSSEDPIKSTLRGILSRHYQMRDNLAGDTKQLCSKPNNTGERALIKRWKFTGVLSHDQEIKL